MTYLLDTNVVSELRKQGRADAKVSAWARSIPAAILFVSVVTIMELEIGILLIERRDAVQGTTLRRWLEERVLPAFEGRVLAVDWPVARRCARMHVPDRRSERDALIGATASVHRMTVATRNTGDFAGLDVPLVNPWD